MGSKEKTLMIVTIILLVIMLVMACYNVYDKKENEQIQNNIVNESDNNNIIENDY